MAQLIVKGQERKKVKKERERDKVVHSWTHTDTVTRSLEVVWRAGVCIACRFLFESRPDLEVAAAAAAAAKGRCPAAPSEPPECRVSRPQMHHKLPPESLWLG